MARMQKRIREYIPNGGYNMLTVQKEEFDATNNLLSEGKIDEALLHKKPLVSEYKKLVAQYKQAESEIFQTRKEKKAFRELMRKLKVKKHGDKKQI